MSLLTIAALSAIGARHELTQQLAHVGTLVWVDHARVLVQRATSSGWHAVVTDLEDESGHSIASMLAALAVAVPSLPVIVYARVNQNTLRKLLAVFTTGLRMECVVLPYERLEPVLTDMLASNYRPGVAPILLQRFAPRAPPTVRLFVALAALTAARRRTVEEVALWSGSSARTVQRRLLHEGWPTARVVLRSFQALDAVWLMSEYGWSAQLVQQVRHFPHASSVTRLLTRYCDSRPGTLHEDGGFAVALEHVTRVLVPRSSS